MGVLFVHLSEFLRKIGVSESSYIYLYIYILLCNTVVLRALQLPKIQSPSERNAPDCPRQ